VATEQVSPKQVYDALTAQGASSIQALGIMSNIINESGFNAGAVGDQGSSFGLVQQHGNYGYLITGNTIADVNAQVSLIKSLGGFQAASGATSADAAGNFAASYERCVGCQPGGAQWSQRVANASTVEGWFKTGNWPPAAGDATLTGIHIPGTPITIPTSPGDVASTLFGGIPSLFGLKSFKDLAERLGLIILGFALVLLGIYILASGGGRKQAPINITTETAEGPEGTATKRKIKTPVSEHKTTRAAGGTMKRAAETGAKGAIEAAAVA
jgi:hypothetical protein